MSEAERGRVSNPAPLDEPMVFAGNGSMLPRLAFIQDSGRRSLRIAGSVQGVNTGRKSDTLQRVKI